MLKKFIHSKEEKWVMARTVVEALLGWIIANAADIMVEIPVNGKVKTLIAGLVVVITSEVLSAIRKLENEEGDQ